jgi:hypothetical protein
VKVAAIRIAAESPKKITISTKSSDQSSIFRPSEVTLLTTKPVSATVIERLKARLQKQDRVQIKSVPQTPSRNVE